MRVVLSHVFTPLNKGDHTLTCSIIKCIKDAFPGAQLFGISRDPSRQRKYFPEVVWHLQLSTSYQDNFLHRRAENALGQLSGLVGGLLPDMSKLFIPNCAGDTIEILRRADLVVASPGGYLKETNRSIFTNLLHLWMAHRFGRPVFLAPQSIGPFRSLVVRELARRVLRRARTVCVRERISLKCAIEELGLPPWRVHRFPDMGFYESDRDLESARDILLAHGLGQGEPFVAVTVIDWDFPFSRTPSKSRARYLRELSRAISEIRRIFGWRSVLIRQISSGAGIQGDLGLIHEVVRRTGENSLALPLAYEPRITRGIIRLAQAMIGSRMHSNIFALTQGTPVIAIAYLPKTHGIMADVGLSKFVVDIEKLSTGQILALFSRIVHTGPSLRKHIRSMVRSLGASRGALTALLRSSAS